MAVNLKVTLYISFIITFYYLKFLKQMLTSLAPEEIRPASASELVSMVTAGGAPASPELVSTATVTVAEGE